MYVSMDVTKKTTKGKRILGTVVASSAADEEQRRKTLHHHWQIWVKGINQTVQNCLFHEDITMGQGKENILQTD
jgi:hypothetical protein